MIEKVYSGGQNGADIGGLKAAKFLGIPTGGWMPNGWITLDGPKPEYAELYGMQEHKMKGYPARTEANVMDSDGTVRFAYDFKSAGEKCTLRNIKWHRKHYFDIRVIKHESGFNISKNSHSTFLTWLKEKNIKILNVAGNSENTYAGMERFVYNYLIEALYEPIFGRPFDRTSLR